MTHPTPRKRILVVDDDDVTRKITQMLVEGLGHEPEPARDGIEALAKLQLDVDLVLLDVMMPGLDGFEVCRRIRKDDTYPDVPVIMVTSLARLAPEDDVHGALMNAAGELVWRAGPVAGNAGLCHGTGGNGFALLALWVRTGDERWLERARAFATHSLDQVDRLRVATGRGRYSLFTGDVGAALLAAACLTGEAGFPGLDDL